MEELEQLDQIIEIDCPPGAIRPDAVLETILEGTGIEPVPAESTWFGNWTFNFNHVPKEIYEKARPIIKERLTKFYNKGVIRYASW